MWKERLSDETIALFDHARYWSKNPTDEPAAPYWRAICEMGQLLADYNYESDNYQVQLDEEASKREKVEATARVAKAKLCDLEARYHLSGGTISCRINNAKASYALQFNHNPTVLYLGMKSYEELKLFIKAFTYGPRNQNALFTPTIQAETMAYLGMNIVLVRGIDYLVVVT